MKINRNIDLFRQDFFFPHKVVLVDGITRTGKSMLGPILSSFRGVEIERMEMILERIVQLYHFGKITKDAAVSLLKIEVQMKLYESMISRNTNFRPSDHSGVFKNTRKLEYLKRFFLPEGESVLERIRKEKPIFQVQQHDVLGMSKVYFDTFGGRLRILEMIRHPVDLIYDQYTRGYGGREDSDPRIWSFTIQKKSKNLLWFCHGWENDYLLSNPMERVIKSIEARTRLYKVGYHNLSDKEKKQVLFIPFEKFVTRPWNYIRKIEEFIGRKATKHTKRSLKRENCPRTLSLKEREKKENEIKNLSSTKNFIILKRLCKDYEKHTNKL